MAAPLLAEVVGGTAFLGFISAVAFATILAVVAGLTLSGAAALVARSVGATSSATARRPSTSSCASRASRPSLLGVLAIVLGIVFKGQNVAFMVGLAFAIAASANFPALLLSMFWRGSRRAARWRAWSPAPTSALVLISLSPTVMVDLLGHDRRSSR